MLRLANILFVVFHSLLIVFNLTGWALKKTRPVHLVCISLTVASWIGLGFWYGFGYCPCTDWHWDVKRSLGESNLPASWVKYYADWITGYDWQPALIDSIVAVAAGAALLLSIGLNARDYLRRIKSDF